MTSKIKHAILVGAGKGGTGKSTLSSLIALSLKKLGYNVAIADIDISGPSIPKIMGITKCLEGNPVDGIIPSKSVDGIPVLSLDLFLNDTRTAILWKGSKRSDYILTSLKDVNWGEKDIDFLIFDLPPTTGNEPQAVISYLQENKISHGTILISTPQDIAVHDVLKFVSMSRRFNLSIIGIIENMCSYVCIKCGTEHRLFGNGRVVAVCKEENIEYLGRIPIIPDISRNSDISLNLKTIPSEVIPCMDGIVQKIIKFYGVDK